MWNIDDETDIAAAVIETAEIHTEDDDAEALLFSSSGSVTITSLTERRARGTFQFILSDLFGEAGSEVRVTSGTFADEDPTVPTTTASIRGMGLWKIGIDLLPVCTSVACACCEFSSIEMRNSATLA